MLWFVGLAFAFLLRWHFLWSDRTPEGQPPLTYLTSNNINQFKHQFDGAAEKARLVLLLSPDMTGLFAGGLRNRRPAETREVGQPDDSGGLGTYTGIRLEQTHATGSCPDFRSQSRAILG